MKVWGVLGSIFLLITAQVRAEELISDIIRKCEFLTQGRTSQAQMVLMIHRPEFVRRVKLRSWTMGKETALIKLLSSGDLSPSTIKLQGRLWNIHATGKMTLIHKKAMLDSWGGSNFTAEDLMGTHQLAENYTHRILRKEKMGTESTVLVEFTPKESVRHSGGKILHWARASDRLPVRQAFFNRQGKLVRTLRMTDYRKVDNQMIPTAILSVNASDPRYSSSLIIEKVLFDRKMPPSLFDTSSMWSGEVLSAGWSFRKLSPDPISQIP